MFDLVMSSGFLCFSSHCGMLRALEATGHEPAAYIGTSSGALAASMAAAGLSADDVALELGGQRPIRLCRPALPTSSGFLSTRALVAKLRTVLPATFEDLPKPCAVGVYAVPPRPKSSFERVAPVRVPVLVTSGDLPLAVAASCAVPGLFKPLALEGRGLCGSTTSDMGGSFALEDGILSQMPTAQALDKITETGAQTVQRYADGGAIDRTGYASWEAWRGGTGSEALVHLISNLPDGSYGPRDGFTGRSAHLRGVVRTPRARASFFSLRDFDAQVDAAAKAAQRGLEVIGMSK